MRVFKFRPPYNKNGNTTFPDSLKQSGVYIIKKGAEIVYVGFSATNLYKTMYRHFQRWDSSTQTRVVYKNTRDITVRIVYCTPSQAVRLEKYLILKHRPKDNPNKYEAYEADYQEREAGEIYRYTETEEVPY